MSTTSERGETRQPELDVTWARDNFPALANRIAGQPVVYFDNPAGTQVPERTVLGIAEYLRHSNANTHGSFATSERTDALVQRAREEVAAFLGARTANEVAFGPNMTTLTYALSRALMRGLRRGDEIIVSDLDHD